MDDLLSAGIEKVELYFHENSSLAIELRQGKVEKVQSRDSQGLGVRAIRDSRLAFTYTTDFSSSGLSRLKEKLNSLLDAVGGDKDYDFAKPAELADVELELADDGYGNIHSLIERCKEAEFAATRRMKSLSLHSVSLLAEVENLWIANSYGLDVGVTRTSYTQSVVALCDVAGGKLSLSTRARKLNNLRQPAELGEELAGLVSSLSGRMQKVRGETPAVFSPQSASTILRILERALDGEKLCCEGTCLKSLIGQRVGAECLNVREDPLARGLYESISFDGEGVATTQKCVIDNGILRTYLHSLHSARKMGVKPTGNAIRSSYSSPPTVSSYNLYIEAGDEPAEAILSNIGGGIFMHSIRVASMDVYTGNFTASGFGWMIRRGELCEPFEPVIFSANLLELLASIRAIGNDLDLSSGCYSPTILVERLMPTSDG